MAVPVNRKHHAIDTAARDRWKLLGRLFRIRRVELGYRFRPAFAEARLPRTPQGNLMVRALNAIENGERPGTYPPESLAQFARAYEVTPESVYAVLRGEADELTPLAPAAPPAAPAEPPWTSPIRDPARRAADAPWAAPIMERLLELRDEGPARPPGRQLFPPGSRWARLWDDPDLAGMDDRDRVWMIADLQRRDAGRNAGSETG